MSKNIVFEGWLTKSPPSKRIWRTKWRRRWFALRQSGELPGQYFLDYYADRNYRRLKGTINLDLCEQVDAGLHMERNGTGSLDPKLRGSVFTIQTQSRTYHLEADCESDMIKWVDAICRVCGLRATDESDDIGPYQSTTVTYSPSTAPESSENVDGRGPYIPISECITGVRAQGAHRQLLDPRGMVMDNRGRLMYHSQPQIRASNADSENESTLSDDECISLNSSQSNIRDYSVTKSFTKLAVSPERNYEEGPPVPPRPPKTFAINRSFLRHTEVYTGPAILAPIDAIEVQVHSPKPSRARTYLRQLSSPSTSNQIRPYDDEEDHPPNHPQYCNLVCLPPTVDRNLKPRPASQGGNGAQPSAFQPATSAPPNSSAPHMTSGPRPHPRPDTLQYLDLDLRPLNSSSKGIVIHGKSLSAADADPAYKTVDFLKTEAFNITRQDAEALRNSHC